MSASGPAAADHFRDVIWDQYPVDVHLAKRPPRVAAATLSARSNRQYWACLIKRPPVFTRRCAAQGAATD